MILIDKKLAEKCADIHYEACEPYVESRLDFLIDLFNAIGSNKFLKYKLEKDINDKYCISIDSIRALLAPILLDKNTFGFSDVHKCFSKGDSSIFNQSQHYFHGAVSFMTSIKKDLDNILRGTPNYLFENYVKKCSEQKSYTGILIKLFNYEKLTGDGFKHTKSYTWSSYKLTNLLDVNVCPYCNKNWVNTVIDEEGIKVTNPQLDHYFSKSDYPLLRLSFYNLIPSCETCNARVKKKKELDIEKHIHPYLGGFDPEYFFAPIPLDTESTFGVGTNYQITLEEEDGSPKFTRSKNSFDFFHIEDVYEQHGDIISEIYYKRAKYNLTTLKDLLIHDMFKGMSLDEAYRFVFANYLKEEDYNKRPFAKLTKDTLRYLELDIK
jgi:hypothetical protein